ncbi:hypothetical protein BDY24DRAFT_382421 [Mrakia frigida]|uniref:uncharacterized protein n=1 Tax=Mrakia frigida TaxID=29902 RepID=UPI003FCC03C4
MSPAPTSLGKIAIEYFGIGGRAQPVYFLLEDAGISSYEKVEVNSTNREDYNGRKFDFAKYPFNQLPVVRLEGGPCLAQQDAILRYFSRVLGYTPTSFEDETIVDMLACSVEDLNRAYTASVYSDDHINQLTALCQITAPKILAQYEYLLSQSKGPKGTFIASEKPSFPEFTLLHIVSGLLILSPSTLKAFPLLSTWYEKMISRAGIASYLASGRKPTMLNGSANGQNKVCE